MFAESYLKLLTVIAPLSCDQAGLTGDSCRLLKLMQRDDLRGKVSEIISKSEKYQDLWLHPLGQQISTPNIVSVVINADLPPELARCAYTKFISPSFDVSECYINGVKITPSQLAEVTAEVTGIKQKLADRDAQMKQIQTQIRSDLGTLFTDPSFDTARELGSCFFDVESAIDHKTSDQYINAIGGAHFPRNFTDSDVQDAKTCESSIHFR
jgi:hypothetical protein